MRLNWASCSNNLFPQTKLWIKVSIFFPQCTKVHINFSAGYNGTYQPCSSCTGTGGTVHKLNCGYIKVSIFFSAGYISTLFQLYGYGGIQPHLQTVNMKLYNVWYMYVYRTHNTKLIFSLFDTFNVYTCTNRTYTLMIIHEIHCT